MVELVVRRDWGSVERWTYDWSACQDLLEIVSSFVSKL